MRRIAVLLLLLTLTASAAPPKKSTAPAVAAPDAIPHPIALFLGTMSRQGARQVTFKATAVGTRFFLEEPSGVTVYRFKNGGYVKETFHRNTKLAAAVKRYAKK